VQNERQQIPLDRSVVCGRHPALAPFLWMALIGLIATQSPAATGAETTTNHWAYQRLVQPPIPLVRQAGKTQNPVDSFIVSALDAKHLQLAPPADKRSLLRRVYFDLIGLPPSPAQVRDFLADRSKDAYEQVVDRLLASPQYGERWGRHWMDVAHFAETHGHDQDRIRTNAWPYRDYLIASFNADKPYSRFVQEQVAGDVLNPEDPKATIALGFLAAGPWDESSLRDIREDTLDRQIGRYLDRDDMVTTVMQTFCSTTVQCARCHNHKFDPIPQQDYYALQAVFAGVDRADRAYDLDPSVHRRRQELLHLRRRVEQDDPTLLTSASTQTEVDDWERGVTAQQAQWHILGPVQFASTGGSTLTLQPDGSLLAGGTRPERDTYTITAEPPAGSITAVRVEVLDDESLPHHGPGRQDNGNLHLSEFQLLFLPPGTSEPVEVALSKATADFDQDGWTIKHAIDRDEKTAWGVYPRVGEPHQAIFELTQPLTAIPGAKLVFVLKQLHGEGHLIGRARVACTSTPSPELVRALPQGVEAALVIPPTARMPEQRRILAAYCLKDRVARELAALPKPSWVYAAAADFEPDGGLKPSIHPRPVNVLRRGEITKPLEAASPGALSCLSALPSTFPLPNCDDEGSRRAALAQWLTSRENPLVWRSIVNRIWHYHFGRGIVDTPNDFGRMGSTPSHPELLDWLAVWFRDQAQGSLKQLHRLIVTSATYRQSCALPGETGKLALQIDPENRLLSHMSRTRLDAEQVRDTILMISGRLDARMGGPSDLQFDLKPGIHVTPRVDYTKFDVDSTAGRRRGVYRFLFRTLPDPFMDALDCPAGDQLTPARNASVTVQQALELWNSSFVARHAEHLAARLQQDRNSLEAQVAWAFELVLGRPCTRTERTEFSTYARQHGLAACCRVLLNSNEFMFLN